MAKRILRKISIQEISGVNSPCQSPALVTILKRDQSSPRKFSSSGRQAILDRANAALALAKVGDEVSSLEAVFGSLAKTEEPAMNDDNDTTKSGLGANFDAHVAAEIAKGCPASVAGQRILQRFGSYPPSLDQIRKQQGSDESLMGEVDKLIAKGCSRTQAMQRARREHPDQFAAFNEV